MALRCIEGMAAVLKDAHVPRTKSYVKNGSSAGG